MEPKKKSNTFNYIVIVTTFLLAFYISFHGSAAYSAVYEGGSAGVDVFNYTLIELERRISDTPFGLYFTDYTVNWLAVLIFIWLIATIYFMTTKRKLIIGKEHGTAIWGTQEDISDLFACNLEKAEIKKVERKMMLKLPSSLGSVENWKSVKADEIKKIKIKYKDADMLLTNSERASIYNFILNNNVVVIGGSGSGKSRGFAVPNLLQAHSSFVVTDPKGELLLKTGHFLISRGYKVRVLNLDSKAKSDYYNPFNYIHPEREGYEERILTLIETIIVNTDGGEKKSSSDPFWDKAEKLFLQALFFFVSIGFNKEERNMDTILFLISLLKIEEDNDKLDSKLDFFVKEFADRFNTKDENGNVVKEHIGVQQYNEFREKAAGKTAKSIVITAVARLAPFRTSEMIRIGSHDTMQLDRIGEEKTAIFVVVPPTDDTFNFVAGMLFTQMFQELQYCATVKHSGRLPVPVRFILDEFANTCVIPNFVKILAYARSFGVGIVPILQSLEQIKNLYEKEWGVIIDNCNYLLYLGSVTHMDTLEYVSKLLGKGTFDKRTSSRSYGKSGGSSKSWDTLGRELLMPDEIRMMKKSKCLLIAGGRRPFYSDKFIYESHPNFSETSDGGAPEYNYEPLKVNDKGKVYTIDSSGNVIFEDNEDVGGEYDDYEFQELLSQSSDEQSDFEHLVPQQQYRVKFPLENQIKAASSIRELLTISKSILKTEDREKWAAVYEALDDIENDGGMFDESANRNIIEALAASNMRDISASGDIDESNALISKVTEIFDIISIILLSNSTFKAKLDGDIDYDAIESDDVESIEEYNEHFDELRNELLDVMIESASA